MKHSAVILAAGQGTRLRPYTNDKPKCMVEIQGKAILLRQLDTLQKAGIEKITVVCGYKPDGIQDSTITKVVNTRYDQTNMVYSLFCAEESINAPFIVCYGDIIYSDAVLHQIMHSESDIVIASDSGWLSYWQSRCEDPLSDAETFEKGENGKVASLGKKAASISEVQGQFIGLIKVSKEGWRVMKREYHQCSKNISCTKNAWNSGKDLDNVYMTDFLNYLANKGLVYYSEIYRGWFEVDNITDLDLANKELNF